MKRLMVVFVFVLMVGFVGAHIVEARWEGKGNWGGGYCNGPGSNQSSTVDQEAHEQFYNDTAELRELIFEKRNEYFAVMNEDNPDKEYAGQIWSEMFDLKEQIRSKAQDAGIEMGFGMAGKRFPSESKFNGPCGGPGSIGCQKTQNIEENE